MLQRIYSALVRYMEANKRDNLEIRTGWRRRLQDIYVAHHRAQNTTASGSPSGLWQNNAGKK